MNDLTPTPAARTAPRTLTPAAAATFVASGLAAGACIGIAATAYLRLGGLQGCVLFAFGLMAVVFFGLNLFTGKSQFAWGRADASDADAVDYATLGAMLVLNIAGCAVMALLSARSQWAVDPGSIVLTRFNDGILLSALKAIPCGFIMTLAVRSARTGLWWPLLFGVPTFIVCGFPHCVADIFYYVSAPALFVEQPLRMFLLYGGTVVGNYLGCNLYRSFKKPQPK